MPVHPILTHDQPRVLAQTIFNISQLLPLNSPDTFLYLRQFGIDLIIDSRLLYQHGYGGRFEFTHTVHRADRLTMDLRCLEHFVQDYQVFPPQHVPELASAVLELVRE